MRLWRRCFPVNLAKFLGTTFFYRTHPDDCFWIKFCKSQKEVYKGTSLLKFLQPCHFQYKMMERSSEKKRPDTTTGGILLKKVSLKVSQNSSTCNRASFSLKLQATGKGFLL